MKRPTILLATAGALVLAAVASLAASIGVASAGTDQATARTAATAAAYPAPRVPNAASIKARYGGQSITFIGDSVGGSHNRDLALAKRFTQDTGIKVKVVPHPAASDASYSQLARVFSSKSSSFDVAMIDVVWPGAFAPYLVDLKPKLGKEAAKHAQGIIQNNTIDGKLVAMPWFGDFGILYYRTDLLRKYGYKAPPKTWTQLFAMAKKIQDGEQAAGKDTFYGLVFQGNSYEGLTCDALEWYQSVGAGGFIDNGKVTINNRKGAAILDQFRAQIGEVTPRGVTTYQEGESHTAFVEGNAAFMRNWPYAYSIGADPKSSKIVGKFSVTTLPRGAGGRAVGTVGGWQLAVNRFSKRVDASVEFVRYMTSPGAQKFSAITNTNVPTIPAVATDRAVVKANPYLKPEIANVARVTRPARYLRTRYNEGSKAIYQGINQILNGRPASSVLPSIQSKLERILR